MAVNLILPGTVDFANYFFLLIFTALIFAIWVISLNVKAVRVVYGLPTAKTVVSYVLGMIISNLVMLLWP